MLSRVLLLAFALYAFASQAGATTEVAVITPTKLLYLADSMQRVNHATGSKGERFCKIGIANDTYWMIAGFNGRGGGLGAFSANLDAETIMRGPGSLAERVDMFNQTLAHQIGEALPYIRATNPADYAHYVGSQTDFIQAAFAEFKGKAPTLRIINYRVVSNAAGQLGVQVSDQVWDGGQSITIFGEHDAIMARFSGPEIRSKMASIQFDKLLINTEIKAIPLYVGPPIAILSVSRSGPHWIQRGVCH